MYQVLNQGAFHSGFDWFQLLSTGFNCFQLVSTGLFNWFLLILKGFSWIRKKSYRFQLAPPHPLLKHASHAVKLRPARQTDHGDALVQKRARGGIGGSGGGGGGGGSAIAAVVQCVDDRLALGTSERLIICSYLPRPSPPPPPSPLLLLLLHLLHVARHVIHGVHENSLVSSQTHGSVFPFSVHGGVFIKGGIGV
jgi:hypothetical protein